MRLIMIIVLITDFITVFDAILTGRQKRPEITVPAWESDGKSHLTKSNPTQFVNRNVKTLGRRFHPPSLKGAGWL